MGSCLSKTGTYISNEFEKKIWGPHVLEVDPIKFYSNDALWNIDFKYFANEIIHNNCSLSINILLTIFTYIDIKQILKCPNQWIIKTAMNQMQTLQPYYKNSKHGYIKTTDQKPQRKSWSLFDKKIINNVLIKKIIIGNIIPFEIADKYYYHHYLREIVVYEPGGYFDKHCDTIIEDYNYTLLLIPPCNYVGGQMIVKHKIVESNKNKWQWILFHKHIKHKCEEILDGYRIVFKIHFSLRKMTKTEIELNEAQKKLGFGKDLDAGDICFDPMATGFPGMNRHDAYIHNVEVFQTRQDYRT
eukprot:444070_1